MNGSEFTSNSLKELFYNSYPELKKWCKEKDALQEIQKNNNLRHISALRLDILKRVEYGAHTDIVAHKNMDNINFIHKLRNEIESESLMVVILSQIHYSDSHKSNSHSLYIDIATVFINKINSKKRLDNLHSLVIQLCRKNKFEGSPRDEEAKRLAYLEHIIKTKLSSLSNSLFFILDEDN